MDFSGIDLINDEVLFHLSENGDSLQEVTELSFKGCCHISDVGLMQAAGVVPKLKKVGKYLVSVFPCCVAEKLKKKNQLGHFFFSTDFKLTI